MRILLTGAAGLLGNALLPALTREHDVVAAFHQSPLDVTTPRTTPVQIDLADADAVASLATRVNPNVVLNCAGAVNVDRCETDHDYALTGNRDFVLNLLRAQSSAGFRLIHISTDYVFDGTAGPPDESATPNPINFYGESKLLGEQAIHAAKNDSCIVRICALYSLDTAAKPNLYSKIVKSLEAGRSFPAATDLYTNPTEVNDLAGALAELVELQELPKMLHLAAPEYLSRYEFALQVARRNRLDESLVKPVTSDEIEFVAERPKHAGLASQFAKSELGLCLKSFGELAAD